MKNKLIFIILFLFVCKTTFAQIESSSCESFELTSIAFRLADIPEYTNNQVAIYTDDIDAYFTCFKDHPLISFIKDQREKRAIGYDGVAWVSACIEIKDGKISARKDIDASQFSESIGYWSAQSFDIFVTLANEFYNATNFHKFYTDHKDLYRVANNRLNEILANIQEAWFIQFFNEEPVKLNVILSLSNGSYNYALRDIYGRRDRFMIVIGCSKIDSQGMPSYDDVDLFSVIHEIMHNYTNPRLTKIWEQIAPASSNIYLPIKDKMQAIGYGSAQVTMLEWMNNLFSLMYLKDTRKDDTYDTLAWLIRDRGFIWMDRALNFVDNFNNNRDAYKSIDDFMSQLVGFINYTAENFDRVESEFENRQPYIVGIYPMSNSIVSMYPDKIVFHFSEPMTESQGIHSIEDEKIDSIYKLRIDSFWQNPYTYVIILNKDQLENNRTYGIKLDRNFFQSQKGYPMLQNYNYTFTTAK